MVPPYGRNEVAMKYFPSALQKGLDFRFRIQGKSNFGRVVARCPPSVHRALAPVI